jgi:hypothetical protein
VDDALLPELAQEAHARGTSPRALRSMQVTSTSRMNR